MLGYGRETKTEKLWSLVGDRGVAMKKQKLQVNRIIYLFIDLINEMGKN